MNIEEFASRGVAAQKAVDQVITGHRRRLVYVSVPSVFNPDLKALKRAEMQKARLENEGYALIHQTSTILTYMKRQATT